MSIDWKSCQLRLVWGLNQEPIDHGIMFIANTLNLSDTLKQESVTNLQIDRHMDKRIPNKLSSWYTVENKHHVHYKIYTNMTVWATFESHFRPQLVIVSQRLFTAGGNQELLILRSFLRPSVSPSARPSVRLCLVRHLTSTACENSIRIKSRSTAYARLSAYAD